MRLLASAMSALLFAALAPLGAAAAIGDAVDNSSDSVSLPLAFVVGGGLEYSQTEIKPAAGASRFKGFGWEAHVGVLFPLSSFFELYGHAEFGSQSFENYANNNTVKENGSNSHYGARAGVFLWKLGAGGGIRKNNIEVDTFSTTSGLRKLKLDGTSPYWWINLWYPVGKRMSLTIEGQYHFGKLDGPANYDFNQYTGRLSLSFMLL